MTLRPRGELSGDTLQTMCRALKVLCASGSPERLLALKRACVATAWELVGGASSLPDLLDQLEAWRPDVLVMDAGLGVDSIDRARAVRPGIRVVSLGEVTGADQVAASLTDLRPAILGLPRPGGPVH